MKKISVLLFIPLLLLGMSSFAQNDGGVSIGKGSNPANQKSILELVSNTKGLLIPRMTDTERIAIFSGSDQSAKGLMVFDNTRNAFYFWDGSAWKAIVSGNVMTVSGPPVTTGATGELVLDTQNSVLYIYDGVKWLKVSGNNTTNVKLELDSSLSGNGTVGSLLTVAQGGITSSHLLDGAVTAAKIRGGGYNTVLTTDGTGTTVWADKSSLGGSVGNSSSVITDNTLTGDGTTSFRLGLSYDAVTSDKIAVGAVTSAKIEDAAVTSTKIAFGSVTSAKIDDDAVTSTKIHDFAVSNSKIEDEAVSTTKIAYEAVMTEKIGYRAVTTERIEEDAITSAKILDGTIQGKDLSSMNAQDGNFLQWKSGYGWLALPGNSGTSGGITKVTPGTGLSGGGSVGDVTLGLANGGVTSSKIADGAIQAANLGQMEATSGQVLQWTGSVWKPATVSGGTGSATNLSASTTGTSMTINSSTGTSTAVIPIGSTSSAGLITAADKIKLDGITGSNTGDQDLTPYALKTTVLERTNTTTFTPSGDYQPATKKYVDDHTGALASIGTTTILGNNTGAAAAPAALSTTQVKTMLAITKADVGLSNVDNTNDLAKPVSTPTQSALDGKVDKNTNITAGTATKITYDSKGLVTAGAAATTADITSVTDKRYVTDAQLAVIGNTSGSNTGDETAAGMLTKLGATTVTGSNTGDQTITLTGNVTGSGTGSFVATIADGAVSTTKIAYEAVMTEKIGYRAVTTERIEEDAITSAKILDGTIQGKDLSSMNAQDGNFLQWKSGYGWLALPGNSGSGGGITAVTAGTGLTGGGSVGDVTLGLANGGVTSSKIADGAILASKLDQMGATASGQVLQWNGSVWKPATVSGGSGGAVVVSPDGTLSGNGTTLSPIGLADGAVSSSKIGAGAVQAVNLGQMGATASGQVLQWDGSVWKPSTVSVGSGAATNLSAITTGTSMTINSSTGTSTAVIPIGSTSSAGLITAADKIKLDAISGTNTGDQSLSLSGKSLTISGTGGNSVDLSSIGGGGIYSLPVASISTLGGVKVGSNLTIDPSNVLSATGITTASQTALDLKEDLLNKSKSIITDGTSDSKYPSVKAVKTYVDANMGDVDASLTVKGNIKLAGDLGGTADLPTVITVGGASSVNIKTGSDLANSATSMNTLGAIVKRDASGNILVTNVTGNLIGNATSATTAGSVTGTVLVPNGGTGITSFTTGNYMNALDANTLQQRTPAEVKLDLGLDKVENTADADKVVSNLTQTALNTKEDVANKSTNVATDATSNIKYPTVNAIKSYVDTRVDAAVLAAGGVPMANSSTLGTIQMTGDLAGTGTSPTVPGLLLKEPLITTLPVTKGGTGITSYTAGNFIYAETASTLQQLTPLQVIAKLGLDQVNNLSDLAKPISTLTQNVLNDKIDLAEKAAYNGVATLDATGKIPSNQIPAISFSSVAVLTQASDVTGLTGAVVGSIAIITGDGTNYVLSQTPASVIGNWKQLMSSPSPVQSVNTKIGNITLTKADIGLLNVDNTTDLLKPLSTATINALLLKEDKTNKSNDGTLSGASNTKYTTENAVKTYVDTKVPAYSSSDGNYVLKVNVGGTGTSWQQAATGSGLTAINANTLLGNNTVSSAVPTALDASTVRTFLSISNVDNTRDLNKPISSFTKTALDLKQDVAYLSSNVTVDATSTTKYPSVSAIKTYVDAQVSNTGITNDITTATAVYPTWVTTNTGNLPVKVSSGKLSFVPSTGTLTATAFSGALGASNLTSGTIPSGRYGSSTIPVSAISASGTANNTTYLRGDGNWATITSGSGDMLKSAYDPAGINQQLVGTTATQTLTNKTLTSPNITAPTGIVKSDVGLGNVQNIDQTNASNLASGTVATARLGSGTASSTTFLRGDGAWVAPTGGTGTTLPTPAMPADKDKVLTVNAAGAAAWSAPASGGSSMIAYNPSGNTNYFCRASGSGVTVVLTGHNHVVTVPAGVWLDYIKIQTNYIELGSQGNWDMTVTYAGKEYNNKADMSDHILPTITMVDIKNTGTHLWLISNANTSIIDYAWQCTALQDGSISFINKGMANHSNTAGNGFYVVLHF